MKEDPLRRAPLVGGNDVLEPSQVLNDIAEAIEGPASRVGLVALHNGPPLRGRHGAGAGVGEQVDQHIGGGKQK